MPILTNFNVLDAIRTAFRMKSEELSYIPETHSINLIDILFQQPN